MLPSQSHAPSAMPSPSHTPHSSTKADPPQLPKQSVDTMQFPSQSKLSSAKVQEPSSKVASSLKLQANELVQPEMSSEQFPQVSGQRSYTGLPPNTKSHPTAATALEQPPNPLVASLSSSHTTPIDSSERPLIAINKSPNVPVPAENVAVALYSMPVLGLYTLIITEFPFWNPGSWEPPNAQLSTEPTAEISNWFPNQTSEPTNSSLICEVQSPEFVIPEESKIPISSPGSKLLIESWNIINWFTPVDDKSDS